MGSPGGGVGGGDRGGPSSPNDDGGNHGNDNNKPDDNKPDRAAGPPGIGAPPSAPDAPDKPDRNDDDDDNRPADSGRSTFDSIVDTLTAPPTDALGNVRSASPVADRINNTENYSFDEVANYLGGQAQGPGVTPDQSAALADGAGVIDQALTTEPLSDLQAAAAIADAELQVATEVYQRETTSRIADIDDRLADINAQLGAGTSNYDAGNLQLAAERNQLTVERRDLEQTLSSQDATERALRGGDDAIGLRADTLEKVVDARNFRADQIDATQRALDDAAYNFDHIRAQALREDLIDLKDDYRSMLDLGMAYQDLIDQQDQLEQGDTIGVPQQASRLFERMLMEGVATVVTLPAGQVAKWTSRLTNNSGPVPEDDITISKRADGVYDVMVPEAQHPSATFESKRSYFEVHPDGTATLTRQVFDGTNLSGNVTVFERNEPISSSDLQQFTRGAVGFDEDGVTLHPDLRSRAEDILDADGHNE